MSLMPINSNTITRAGRQIINDNKLRIILDFEKAKCNQAYAQALRNKDTDTIEFTTKKNNLIDLCKHSIEEHRAKGATSPEVQIFKNKLLNIGLDRDIVSGWITGLK